MKNVPGLLVPELVGFGDVGVERGELGGHGGNDAGAIGAAQRQDEIGRHERLPGDWASIAAQGVAVKRTGDQP